MKILERTRRMCFASTVALGFALIACLLIAHIVSFSFQIRRYVYHDVIRLVDAGKLMDCSLVQAYRTNSARVVFLNQRPQTRQPRGYGSGTLCVTCDRNLQESYLFCSISCKVEHIVKNGGNMWDYLLPVDEGQMTPDSVLVAESGSSTESTNVSCSTATCEVVKKKRRNGVCRSTARMTVTINRRKSTPRRSPFC